jgi:hypothetical protein
MSENENSTPSPAPAAVTAKVAPPVFTPVAVHLTTKLRANAIEAVKTLAPVGNPNPDVLAVAKTAALALIDTFPDADGIETRIEISGAKAHQILVQITPHSL